MTVKIIEGEDPRFAQQEESVKLFFKELETLMEKRGIHWIFIGVSKPVKFEGSEGLEGSIGCAGFANSFMSGATPEQFASIQKVIDRAVAGIFDTIKKKVLLAEFTKALAKELSE